VSGSGIKWGNGQAELVPRSTKEETERVAFIPDTHFPYQDPALVKSALALVKWFKPHRIIHLGDLVDFHSISRWNSALERLDDLQDEIDEATDFLYDLRNAAPDANIRWCEGNHDERLKKYVATEASAIRSLRDLTVVRQFHLVELEIAYHGGEGFLLRKEFLCKHGTMIRSGAGATAKAECLAAGISGISGHTHRLAPYRREGYRSLQWNEAGTLSRLDPPYNPGRPDWKQGMVLGYFGKTAWRVEEVHAEAGKLVYGGRSF
jgi:predicted phosphodiesterase